jgi:hypothetical protein
MANTGTEFVDVFKKFIADVPANSKGAFTGIAEFNGKLAEIALDTAKKNTALSQAWANDTLGSIDVLSKRQENVSGYATAAKEFASVQAQSAPEKVNAFAEVIKQAQIQTVELLFSAGTELQANTSKVAKKAASSKTAAASKS